MCMPGCMMFAAPPLTSLLRVSAVSMSEASESLNSLSTSSSFMDPYFFWNSASFAVLPTITLGLVTDGSSAPAEAGAVADEEVAGGCVAPKEGSSVEEAGAGVPAVGVVVEERVEKGAAAPGAGAGAAPSVPVEKLKPPPGAGAGAGGAGVVVLLLAPPAAAPPPAGAPPKLNALPDCGAAAGAGAAVVEEEEKLKPVAGVVPVDG